MSSRELVYKIILQTNDAKRQAGNIRAAFENELRQIKVGGLDTSSLKTATDQARQLRQELENVKPPNVGSGGNGGFLGKGIDDAVGQLKALATGYIGVQGAVVAFNTAIDLSRLNTQNQRAGKGFELLSKGAEEADVNLLAIQRSAGGAVTSLDAIAIGNQAAALGLAKTTQGFADLARASKIITQVSPSINDQGEALSQLALFASNAASYARADQLGLAASEVRDRIEDLRKTYTDLDDSQLKLLASTQILEEKFGSLLNTVEARASGLERLTANYNEFKLAVAGSGVVGPVDATAGAAASAFSQLTTYIAGTNVPLNTLINNLKETQRQAEALDKLNPMTRSALSGVMSGIDYLPGGGLLPDSLFGLDIGSINADSDKLKQLLSALDLATGAVSAGVPGAKEYLNSITAIAVEADKQNAVTVQQAIEISRLTAAYTEAAEAGGLLVAQQRQQAEAARLAEQSRQGRVFDQQAVIELALASRAQKTSQLPGVGIEQAIETYRQQREAARAAIDELVKTGVSNDGEIAIRVAAITQTLMQPFDELEARASQGFTIDVGAFDQVGAALSNISAGFVDFLPGIESARSELISLSEELAITGSLSDEQAARLEYLSTVAYAVADGSSQLGLVVGELGGAFLESNSYAAELVTQLYLAEVAYRNNQIGAGEYAGMTTYLSGRLLTLAQAAGIATGELYALNQAQADMANLPGYGAGQQMGGSIAQRIQTQQAASGREQNRREMERYNTAVARQQESSAKRAGKALEDGAKKASQELKSALDKVPGLFSTTDVTEKDMQAAKDGTYTDKADEKLRRLRDEVKNGVDWADVSIEDAKSSIEKLGITAANTKEGILAQFEDLWNSQALWADMSNIEQWIDKGAVEQQMMLQQKSEEGRNNIYKFFGVQIDEATSAATGGGGAAPAPVAPPKLVDIDPLTEGLQTGLDEYVNANGEVIKEKVAQAQALFFDPANLFGTGGAPGGKNAGAMGPAQKPGAAIVTADATLQALTPYITGQQQATIQMQATGAAFGPQPQGTAPTSTSGAVTLTPTLDAATLQAELAKLTLTITPAFLVAEVEKQNIISAVGAIVPTVNVALAVSAEAGTMTTLVQSINTELRTIQPDIRREGTTAAQMLAAGLTTALGGADAPVDVSTPLITALTANVAASAPLFATPGTMVAQIIMAAILANMQGQQQGQGGGEGGGGPIAAALVTNMITQFATATPQFMAAGVVPAQLVEAGFKSHPYTGMADNLQASINQSVGAKAAEFIQVGGYIGGWIQQGINQAFTAEVNLSFAVNAGASWGTAFMKGALSAVGGGTLVQAISDKVVTDLATELEK